jgi:hypothetical protein
MLLAYLVHESLDDKRVLEYVLAQRMIEHHGLPRLLARPSSLPLPLPPALLHYTAFHASEIFMCVPCSVAVPDPFVFGDPDPIVRCKAPDADSDPDLLIIQQK